MPSSGSGKLTYGFDNNYFAKILVSSTSFNSNADVVAQVKYVSHLSLINEGSVAIEYSFNGNTVHGDLTPGTPSAGLVFDDRPKCALIWFRLKSAGSSLIRVEMWG